MKYKTSITEYFNKGYYLSSDKCMSIEEIKFFVEKWDKINKRKYIGNQINWIFSRKNKNLHEKYSSISLDIFDEKGNKINIENQLL